METQPNHEDREARDLAHRYDALIAEKDREAAALREQRAEIERRFHVKLAEERAQAAEAAAEERRQLDGEMVEASEAMFSAIERSQRHFEAAVDAFNEAIEANGRVRSIGRRIAPTEKLPLGLALAEMVARFGGRISSTLRSVKIPGMVGPPPRLGILELPAEPVSPKGDAAQGSPGWRAREERVQVSAINHILAHGRGE